jgi:glutamate racemase
MSPISGASRPIAIFDSGIGGLPYLEAASACLPRESFVYLADRAGFPYGSKARPEVKAIVLGIVARLIEAFDPKALLIACNTASQAALEAARKAHPGLPIVGTVPAVKPAAERSRSGVIGILGSAGAVEDPYLDALVARYARDVEVIREGAQELVTFVERRAATADGTERRAAVAPVIARLVERGADEIVLACTHFLHLREAIAAEAGDGVEVVDSREGVVRRLRQVLSERGLLNPEGPVARERGLLNPEGPVARERGRFLLTGAEPFEDEYGLLAVAYGLSPPESSPS